MEIILAFVVAFAVIFFGAMISIGNERQRKAIDNLREQAVLWAMQDLKIKREHLTRSVQIPDPLGWLNRTASKVFGSDLQLQILEFIEVQQSIVCESGNGDIRVIFSPLSIGDIRRINRAKQNRLARFAYNNPFSFILGNRNVRIFELSVLNIGIMFDMEFQSTWASLTGHDLNDVEKVWMYVISIT